MPASTKTKNIHVFHHPRPHRFNRLLRRSGPDLTKKATEINTIPILKETRTLIVPVENMKTRIDPLFIPVLFLIPIPKLIHLLQIDRDPNQDQDLNPNQD